MQSLLKLSKFPVPQGSQQELESPTELEFAATAELSAGVVASSAYTCPAKKAGANKAVDRMGNKNCFLHFEIPFFSFYLLYYTLFLKILKLLTYLHLKYSPFKQKKLGLKSQTF